MAKGRMASMFSVGSAVTFHIDGRECHGVIRKVYATSGRAGHCKVKSPGEKTVTRKLDQVQRVNKSTGYCVACGRKMITTNHMCDQCRHKDGLRNASYNSNYVRSNRGHVSETRNASDESLRGTNSERRSSQ